MSNTITIRFAPHVRKWLEETSKSTGLPIGRLVNDAVRRTIESREERPFMKYAGCINGLPRDLSMRKGFSNSVGNERSRKTQRR